MKPFFVRAARATASRATMNRAAAVIADWIAAVGVESAPRDAHLLTHGDDPREVVIVPATDYWKWIGILVNDPDGNGKVQIPGLAGRTHRQVGGVSSDRTLSRLTVGRRRADRQSSRFLRSRW